jgi:hypothetical protein
MPVISSAGQTLPSTARIESAIATASARTGVDFAFLVSEARIESGLDPDARARSSSATGLFQFTRQTWLATVKAHGANHDLGWAADAITQGSNGQYHVADPALRSRILDLRTQPEAAAAMAAELASGHEDFLAEQLGRTPEPVDLYLAHFLGGAGAARFLRAHDVDPDGAAAALLPAAASANRAVFYQGDGTPRSFAEIRANFAVKLGGEQPAPPFAQNLSKGRTDFSTAQAQRRTVLQQAQDERTNDTLQLRTIDPMPQRLSLDFARSAYQRLAALGSAA